MRRLRKGLAERIDRHGAALSTDARALLLERVVADIKWVVDAVADRSIRSTVYDRPALAQFWPIPEFDEDDGAEDVVLDEDEDDAPEDESAVVALTEARVEALRRRQSSAYSETAAGLLWSLPLTGWPSNVSAKQAAEAFTRLLTTAEQEAVELEAERGARSQFWPRTIVENIYDPALTPAGVDELTKAMARRVERTAPVEQQPVLQAVVARAKALLPRVVLVVSAINEVQEARDAHVRVPTAILSTLTAARSGAVQRVEKSNDDVFTTMDLRKFAMLEGHGEGAARGALPNLSRAVFDVRPSGRLHTVQLSLPLFADSGDRLADLRRFLNDWELRAYLGTFALLTPREGRDFLLDESSFLLDVLGLSPRMMKREKQGLPPFPRPRDADEQRLRVAIETLQSTVITKVVDPRGDIRLEKPERLIEKVNRYTTSGMSAVWFQHSLAAWKLAQSDFVQVPRAAMRLEAELAALGAGVALVVRDHAIGGDGWLERGGAVRLRLADWAQLAGEPVAVRLHSRGRPWWATMREKLKAAVEQGGFGQLHVRAGDYGDQLLELAPSAVLSTAYAPLLARRDEAVERNAAALAEADVRNLMPPKRKPGRPRKRLP